jgi:hypothetical protein
MGEKQSESKSDKERSIQQEAKDVRRASQLRKDREKEKQAGAG